MCNYAQVSSSGFYYWKSHVCEVEDTIEEDLIRLIFAHRKAKAGARTIKMILARQFWMIINLKKIRRIMRLHRLRTTIRRKNKHSVFSAATYEHKTCQNHLDRRFSPEKKDMVYSTDITYLHYGNGAKAYLSAVKDLGTKEIIHHHLSRSLGFSLATEGLPKLLEVLPASKRKGLIIHSDQGLHYTSRPYRDLMGKFGVIQSMSRRGNCLDNAPIESFFGHMKDELDLRNCKTYEDLVAEIDSFINYYNNERPQWGLKGKTPAECRGFS